MLSKYIHINYNKAKSNTLSPFDFNSIWIQRTDAEANQCGSLNTALTELARCRSDPRRGSICLVAWEQKLCLLLGGLICFVLKVACMATIKIQPSLHVQPSVGQTFCYAVEKKYLVYSVHQYNVCVCICILFSSFKTMLRKLWLCTCKDRRNYMEGAWRRWNVWSCAQSEVLSNADT